MKAFGAARLATWLSAMVLLGFCLSWGAEPAAALQIQIGTVKVTVSDPNASRVPAAAVTLANSLTGFRRRALTDEHGACVFNNVPFDDYLLQVETAQFKQSHLSVSVRSNLPVELDITLLLTGTRESVDVEAEPGLIEKSSTNTELDLDESSIRRAPGAIRSVQQLISTMPGWTTENNDLLHIRGVDDGILFVIDGIPVNDRVDRTTATGFDPAMIGSMNILTGNIPAEFGGKTGAVVTILPKSGIARRLFGSFETAAESFRTGEAWTGIGGGKKNGGFFLCASGNRSDRFLDPVDPRNFNNRGGAVRLNGRADWHPTSDDIVIFTASVNGSDLRVPNTEHQELAGQRQRQELRDNSQSVSWQRVWSPRLVTNIAGYHRFYEAKLIGSAFDTPLFASQDRHHSRVGLLASITHQLRGHTVKAGVEATRVSPREFFTFAVTDPEAAEEEGLSEAAIAFDLSNPFVFRDRRTRGQVSWYVQDNFSPLENLTVSAGLRYDHSSLLVSHQQFSPRAGAVYYLPKTRTAIRGSFNRLFQPPQVENLLLSDSEQARALSPFVGSIGGGENVRPERISAYEAAVAQDVRGWFKFDAAFWWRSFKNHDDPNVFFSTTVIFPNSVAKGFARGVDVRLDVPERHGWSGFLSYTNQRILQTGPINGGLFLTDEVIEIGPGTKFIPDHDQRNIGAAAVMYRHARSGIWASVSGRHESGVPLEVEEDALEDLQQAPGAERVDFRRQRVKPWTVFGLSAGVELFRGEWAKLDIQMDIQNVADRKFAYNFGNPFEGTHFGYPRLWSGRVRVSFR